MVKENVKIKGMHCASCAYNIKKSLHKLEGITLCEVNYATEEAQLEYNPALIQLEDMNNVIKKLGYSFIFSNNSNSAQLNDDKSSQFIELRTKVQYVLPITLVVFIIMLWDIASSIFSFIPNLPYSMNMLNFILFFLASVQLFGIGLPYLKGIFQFIRYGNANMDTLIGIGTVSAYIYSVFIFFFPTISELFHFPSNTYFDVTIVVIGFVTLGKFLEVKSKTQTNTAVEKLISLQSKTAIVQRDNKEIEILFDEIRLNDILIIKPGSKIPVDGTIVFGTTSIDESMLTGESIPKDKSINDYVIGGTINKQGYIKIIATKIGDETILAQIIKTVKDAQGSKAPIQSLADTVSAIFVPVVLVIAILTLLVWIGIGTHFIGISSAISYGILSFVGVLVIACPCALGLATPTGIIVGVGKGAEHGILIKNAESLEKLAQIDTVVFDKTGTITQGKPTITDIELFDTNLTKNELLQIVASIEKLSEHPLAHAVLENAKDQNLSLFEVTHFSLHDGHGVTGVVNTKEYKIIKPPTKLNNIKVDELQKEGKTVIIITENSQLIGAIAICDIVKENAKRTIDLLHTLDIHVVMLTGDNKYVANNIGKKVGIDTIIAEVLPNEKAKEIQKLQEKGNKIAMAGDGINDAPALAQSDVGVAMATGSDIAIESADIILLNGDIQKLYQAIFLSQSTLKTIKQNLFWAFIYNVVGIPIASGILYPFFGILLNPVFAGLAMALSSVSVVSNSLRLQFKKL
ncbi:MAG: heavy metal translocating P-type ATPase [Candidatus Roizmanbacteria bacterium]